MQDYFVSRSENVLSFFLHFSVAFLAILCACINPNWTPTVVDMLVCMMWDRDSMQYNETYCQNALKELAGYILSFCHLIINRHAV
jgi:hypothetical protein